MPDQWEWWRAALGGTFGPNSADEPQAGFFRSRSRNNRTCEVTYRPIAYWYDPAAWPTEGTKAKLFCKLGSSLLPDIRAREQWPFVAEHPITKELYDAVRAGGPWPDANQAAERDRINSAGMADPNSFESLRDRIEDLAREGERLIKAGPAKTKEESDTAADLADRLRKLEVCADDERKTEKREHDHAIERINAKWFKPRDRASDVKARLKRLVVTPYLIAIDAANRKAEAEAIQSGKPPEAAPTQRRTAGSTTTVALKATKLAIIEDYGQTLGYFANNEQVNELVQRLANASARAGTCPPGCKLDERQVAA